MFTSLTFAILKYGFLIALWVFVWLIIRSLRRDLSIISPQTSQALKRSQRQERKRQRAHMRRQEQPTRAASAAHTASASLASAGNAASAMGAMGASNGGNTARTAPAAQGSLLVIIDGPMAGASLPLNASLNASLNGQPITIGRAPSNTLVLNDEFASSHHAQLFFDQATQRWMVEDLGSTNGTMVNHRRISEPTALSVGEPIRIGATTCELR